MEVHLKRQHVVEAILEVSDHVFVLLFCVAVCMFNHLYDHTILSNSTFLSTGGSDILIKCT